LASAGDQAAHWLGEMPILANKYRSSVNRTSIENPEVWKRLAPRIELESMREWLTAPLNWRGVQWRHRNMHPVFCFVAPLFGGPFGDEITSTAFLADAAIIRRLQKLGRGMPASTGFLFCGDSGKAFARGRSIMLLSARAQA
jgi:hypothetical protein